jgi:hypothetical protein
LNPFLERSVFLRSLNYLRVKHQFAARYSFFYPMLFSALTGVCFFMFTHQIDVYGVDGLLVKLTPFLAIIAPFFLASLAAVATFGGSESLDAPFDTAEPVTLIVVGEMGALDSLDVTPRHFLSLLFGYCCVVALNLFLFAIFVPQIAVGLSNLIGVNSSYVGWAGLFVFLFFFYQVILATLLGIYYLSDKIHR